ncbi:hypothetical protein AAU57_13785 [Nonlabens sp. YIK11]|nr:hypothetical protein AAU57_13785 [Nonlabens sp. YIK11]
MSSCGQNNSAEKESDLDIPVLKVEKPQEEKEVIVEEHTSNSIRSSEVQMDKPNYTNGIQPDFFDINASQFSQFKEDSSKWFISSDGKSNLYFVPYTDYSITTAILTEKKLPIRN